MITIDLSGSPFILICVLIEIGLISFLRNMPRFPEPWEYYWALQVIWTSEPLRDI